MVAQRPLASWLFLIVLVAVWLAGTARAQGDPIHPLRLAERLMNNQQYQKARTVLERFLAKRPGHPEAVLLVGQSYFLAGEAAATVAVFDAKLPADRRDDRHELLLARAHLQLREFEKSTAHFQRALRRNQLLPVAGYAFDYARALRGAHRCNEAKAYFDKAFAADARQLKVNPAYYRQRAGCAFESGHFATARQLLRRAILLGLDDSRLLDDLGWAQLALGQDYQATDSFQSAWARLQPRRATAAVPLRLALPFDGRAEVRRGPAMPPHHLGGRAHYAVDLVYLGDNRRAVGGFGRTNADYYCFGTAVRAPLSGIVAWVRDGIGDHPPDRPAWNAGYGNQVLIEETGGLFVRLAHLRHGSLRVKRGDRVEVGQVVGACGNSGHAETAQLHVDVLDGPADDALSKPFVFVDYVADREGRIQAHRQGVPKTGTVIGPCVGRCQRLKKR